MAITTQDVKIFKSEVTADTPDGGGRMTGNEVIDGELNNVFDDTSRDDRVNGRVSLRKVYGAVVTATTDKYLGSQAIITDPPADGRVHVAILDRNDHTDHRADVQAQVEQFLVAGQVSTLTLWDTQPQFARTLVAYQEATLPVPDVSDVLCLSVELVSHASFGHQQFVRITSLSSDLVQYDDLVNTDDKTKTCRILTIGISEPLEINFPGDDLVEFPLTINKPTRVRKTALNPSSRYYGIRPLVEDVTAGDTTIFVDSILQPIVPATYAETPILDQQLGGETAAMIAAGPEMSLSFSRTAVAGTIALQLPIGLEPGSLTLLCDASGTDNDVTLIDDAGDLARESGGSGTAAAAGSVVYASGQIAVTGLPNVAYSVTATFTPAAAVSSVQYTAGVEITESNRGFNYNKTLIPKPSPGTAVFTFRALGRWYTLQDNGQGQLVGDAGVGAGTVNYITGTVNATCGYEPDVGSFVLFGWATGVHYAQSVDPLGLDIGAINGGIGAGAGLLPGTVEITYPYGVDTKTATDNGLGAFTGDGDGSVDYASGLIRFVPSVLPAAGTVFHIEAERKTRYVETPSVATDGAYKEFTVANAPIQVSTARVRAVYATAGGTQVAIEFYQSSGNLVQYTSVWGTTSIGPVGGGEVRGTANITTGEFSLLTLLADAYQTFVYDADNGEWDAQFEDLTFSYLQWVDYIESAGSPVADDLDAPLSTLRVDFSRGLAVGAVAGSILFTLNGRDYYDRTGALCYRDALGDEHVAGSIDYLSGTGLLTDWAAGTLAVTFHALLTRYGAWKLGRMTWRTPGSPLRSESFQVTDGTHVATAEADGDLSGASTFITGHVDIETGVYDVTFSPAVAPEIARYNAVALSYLPLDATLLGLNPVRLPLDGRVPVIQSAYTLVLVNSQYFSLPNPAIAGQTYALPRGALAYAVMRDGSGTKIPTDRYTSDLDIGSVTMANPLDLSGYVQPLIVEHRIEDAVLCLDAQLNGQVQISGAITHDYVAGESYVCSAKRYGDLQARASNLFEQSTWTNEWSDTLIGIAPSAQYDVVNHPIEVTNAGAITERWRLEVMTSTTFRLIGEERGVVLTGGMDVDFAPINPGSPTGAPYLVVRAAGWGSGWVPGNQVRFNTSACAAPIWLLRCTLQGPAEEPNDSFRLQFRGDN